MDRFVKNEIDQDFLKSSSMPFASVRSQIAQHYDRESRYMNSNSAFNASHTHGANSSIVLRANSNKTPGAIMAKQNRFFSETGNVPFSSAHRGKADDAPDRNNSLQKTAFAWKSPTVMRI